MEQLTAVCPKCGGTQFKVIPHPDRKDRISGAICIKCNYFLSPLAVVEISENQQGIPLNAEQKPS
jgi:predicted  nucleic acid-binding Zn-ribbon protein